MSHSRNNLWCLQPMGSDFHPKPTCWAQQDRPNGLESILLGQTKGSYILTWSSFYHRGRSETAKRSRTSSFSSTGLELAIQSASMTKHTHEKGFFINPSSRRRQREVERPHSPALNWRASHSIFKHDETYLWKRVCYKPKRQVRIGFPTKNLDRGWRTDISIWWSVVSDTSWHKEMVSN